MKDQIIIKQSSEREDEDQNYWNWSIWIDASDEIINQIDMVEYILHPTFYNRVRRITTKEDKFILSSKGWGEFMIHIKIYVSNKEEPIQKKHYLNLFSDEIEMSEIKPEIKTKVKSKVKANVQKAKPKTVFISSAMSDYKKVEELTNELNKNKIEVKTQETIEIESNFTEDLNNAIEASDVFILYGLENLTKSQEFELNVAIDANKEIIIQANDKEEIDRSILKNRKIENLKIIKTNNDIVGLI